MNTIVRLICILLLPYLSYAQTVQKDEILREKIDHYLTEGSKNGFSGAVLIARKGDIIINKGYGLAHKETKRPNTPKTVFSTGSVTKQFTATAILKLAEMGKLELTDAISTFFEGLPQDKKDITLHQLLTHSSGLVGSVGDGDFDYISTKDYFETLFTTELRYEPGTKHQYSNAGYSALARIVELVSEMDYEAFLQKHLFEPSGMTQTGYLMPEWKDNMLAHGYIRGVRHWGAMIPRFQNAGKISWALKGNGGIQSTQEDMFKWYKALKSNTILTQSSMNLLTTPYIQEQEGSDESYYAYGWAIFNSKRKTKIVTHNGSNGIFFHEFMWLPEEDVVLLFSTNGYSPEVEVIWKLEKMVFDPSYDPKPIKKNPYTIVLDFIEKYNPKQSSALLALLKEAYGNDFEDPNLFNRIGYMLLENDKTSDWILELFLLNVQLFPDNANLWDSLGDGYKNRNDKENAVKSYKKALALDPSISASRNSLSELGVLIDDIPEKEIMLDIQTLKSYVGDYQIPSGHTIKIIENEGDLFVEFPGRFAMKLTPMSTIKFTIGNRDAALVFNKSDTSEIESFTLFESGEQMIAKRR
ncbi:serine hydrolase [Aureisphaera galaxeae]|uniref:serine hydrolase n=1 Tax=Aureisphaera galaxeae TaxID=1538023 RepID=UPI00235064F2|nr:serine hydrolase [Aureisphaera galaxeae]MDC8004264.1 serine hydrolase [Aureisphaera galaxeae]